MVAPMFPAKRVWGFVVRLLLFYGLLIAPWPGLRDAYAAFFRACGNQLFSSFGSQGVVRFQPPSKPNTAWDTEVLLKSRQQGSSWLMGYQSRHSGYLPTVGLIALALASPITWRRRWQVLVWGLIFVNVFIALRVAVSLVYQFRHVGLYVFRPLYDRAITVIYEAVSVSILTSCVVPVLIWILVCFRREDLEPFMRQERPHAT